MSIEANVAARNAGETIAELIQDELQPLVKRYGTECLPAFFGVLRAAFGNNLRMVEPTTPQREMPARPARAQGDDADSALESIEEALELVEKVPERGQEFAESVADNLRSIAEKIEETDEVTAGQLSAIENMRAGLERWVR